MRYHLVSVLTVLAIVANRSTVVSSVEDDLCWMTFDEGRVTAFKFETSRNEFTTLGSASFDEHRVPSTTSSRRSSASVCRHERANVMRINDERLTLLIRRDENAIRLVDYDRKRFVGRLRNATNATIVGIEDNDESHAIGDLFEVPTNERLAAWSLLTTNDKNGSSYRFVLLTGGNGDRIDPRRATTRSRFWDRLRLCVYDTFASNRSSFDRDNDDGDDASSNDCANRTIRYVVPVSSTNVRFCAHSVHDSRRNVTVTFLIEHKSLSDHDNFLRVWLYANDRYRGSFNLPRCPRCSRVSGVDRVRTSNLDDDELWSLLVTDSQDVPVMRLWTFASIVEHRMFATRYDNGDRAFEFKLGESAPVVRRMRELWIDGTIEAATKLVRCDFRVIDSDDGLIALGPRFKRYCRTTKRDTLRECERTIDETNALTMRTNAFVPESMRRALNEHANVWQRVSCARLLTDNSSGTVRPSIDRDETTRRNDRITDNNGRGKGRIIAIGRGVRIVDEHGRVTEVGRGVRIIDDNGRIIGDDYHVDDHDDDDNGRVADNDDNSRVADNNDVVDNNGRVVDNDHSRRNVSTNDASKNDDVVSSSMMILPMMTKAFIDVDPAKDENDNDDDVVDATATVVFNVTDATTTTIGTVDGGQTNFVILISTLIGVLVFSVGTFCITMFTYVRYCTK